VRIGLNSDGGRTFEELVARVRHGRDTGYSSLWLPESPGDGPRRRSTRAHRHRLFGFDSLTALAAVGHELGGVEVGTCVVPTYPRHPMQLAVQTLTVAAATKGRFTLGVGVSHRHVVEDQWGYAYDRTAKRMEEYLTILAELMTTGEVHHDGPTAHANGSLSIPNEQVPVLVAALGPRMLDVAGRYSDGVITWMTGPRTLREHVVPRLQESADRAGRPPLRVVASLPVCITGDPVEARELAARMFIMYRSLPNYRRMLEREDVDDAGGVALIGSEDEVREQLDSLAESGVTDLNALVIGTPDEVEQTHQALPLLSSEPTTPGASHLSAGKGNS
jgi:5,10-methylenetetrahydromethanopterin reductase